MANSVNFEISTTNDFLSELLEDALDKAVSSEPMNVNSVEIILTRVGSAEIRPEGKKVDIFLPLKINLKRAAGLFTVEGNGSINLHLAVDFDISENLKLKTKTELVSHEWLEKPILEIGALNIPVETLVNLVLNHHESIITAKIDSSLKDYSDLNSLLQKGLVDARNKIGALDLKGNRIDVHIDEVALVPPSILDGRITIKGQIDPQISINSMSIRSESEVPFKWIEESAITDDTDIRIPINLSYDFMGKEVKRILQGVEVGGKHFDVVSIRISGGEELNIEMEINEPIKAQVFIVGRPIYNEIEGELYMKDLDVKVNPSNFIYKLTAPLVNRFIESKMEEFFPMALNAKISGLVKENLPPEIKLQNANIMVAQDEVSILELDFQNAAVEGIAMIKGLGVKSVIS